MLSSPPTGTLTFLFTDIEGSSKLWERDSSVMRVALARHDEILRSAIEERGGYVFKTVGDAFCCAFRTAPDALEAALDAQRLLLKECWAESTPLRVRMALHTGATEEREGDYFGPPVNRVTRLLSAAHGTQVLLSLATQELVRGQLPAGAALKDLGEHRLKDLFRPERVFQLVAPALPSEFPPLRTLEAKLNNLPLQPTPLVGREREVEEVAERLRSDQVRLLTLTGPGGTGKTRLALQVAADLLEQFDDGVFFVSLATITDPELVPSTIAKPLGVKESAEHSLRETLERYLHRKHLLLILDNLEQVLEGTSVAGELVAACPDLKVLATSRTPLRLYGEQEYPVPPLALPDQRVLPSPEVLIQYEAIRLFVERARAVKADFELTNENAAAVAEICARLDGLPLAIELAAARVRLLSPQAMLTRLDNRLKLLTGGPRDSPARQQTLRGTIDWSYELLTGGAKTLLGRLSVFSGGCTLEAIEEVCDPEADLDALEGVESLLEKSLLRREDGAGGEPRFVMLETVQEYAREKLVESGQAEEMKRAHAEYFLALAEEAEPAVEGPQQAAWLERLEAEHDNLRAALSWSLERGEEAELGLRVGAALGQFWYLRGYFREGRRWLEEALAKASPAPTAARASALRRLSYLAYLQGDLDRAQEASEEGLKLEGVERFRGVGGRSSVAADLRTTLGTAVSARGDPARAVQLYEESLALSRNVGDERGVMANLIWLGIEMRSQGNFEKATQFLEEGLVLSRKLGEPESPAAFLTQLCDAFVLQGDLERATAVGEEAAAMLREQKNRLLLSDALCNLGWAALLGGDTERATTLYAESLELKRELGDRLALPETLDGLACVAVAKGEAERAVRLFGATRALNEQVSDHTITRDYAALREPYLAVTRSQLSEETWEAAFAEGRAMGFGEAVENALFEQH